MKKVIVKETKLYRLKFRISILKFLLLSSSTSRVISKELFKNKVEISF